MIKKFAFEVTVTLVLLTAITLASLISATPQTTVVHDAEKAVVNYVLCNNATTSPMPFELSLSCEGAATAYADVPNILSRQCLNGNISALIFSTNNSETKVSCTLTAQNINEQSSIPNINFECIPRMWCIAQDGKIFTEGEQQKIINGCIDSFNHKQCADNYQFTTCSGGVWQGMSQCYPSEACQVPAVAVVLPGVNTNKFSLFLLFAVIIIIGGVIAIVYLNYLKPRKKNR